MKLDLLAIAAHPDDVELTCGGTLLKMAAHRLQDRHPRPHRRRNGHPRHSRNSRQRSRQDPPRFFA